ncbi:hypothetical protein DP119_00515 [Planococcus maitriensis]|uniref:Uncharacterized protein n=1 Tax=Planococcus maitriensis TaxID=221799 RepID=A0A365K9Z5_9BACL|nr:hypothetical protein DP119_00515 [Planococcus maitriensis]
MHLNVILGITIDTFEMCDLITKRNQDPIIILDYLQEADYIRCENYVYMSPNYFKTYKSRYEKITYYMSRYINPGTWK